MSFFKADQDQKISKIIQRQQINSLKQPQSQFYNLKKLDFSKIQIKQRESVQRNLSDYFQTIERDAPSSQQIENQIQTIKYKSLLQLTISLDFYHLKQLVFGNNNIQSLESVCSLKAPFLSVMQFKDEKITNLKPLARTCFKLTSLSISNSVVLPDQLKAVQRMKQSSKMRIIQFYKTKLLTSEPIQAFSSSFIKMETQDLYNLRLVKSSQKNLEYRMLQSIKKRFDNVKIFRNIFWQLFGL